MKNGRRYAILVNVRKPLPKGADNLIFLFLLPLYLAGVIYMLLRFFYWVKNCHHVFNWMPFKIPVAIWFSASSLTPLIVLLLPKNAVTIVIRRYSTYWIGILLYLLMFIALFDLIRLIARHTKLKNTMLFTRVGIISAGSIIAMCAAAVCIYGFLNARHITVSNFEVTINKTCGGIKDMKVVLIADTHMGYAIGADQIEQMAERINEQDADLVVFAGDIFDNSYKNLDDPERIAKAFRSIKSKYGIYAVFGNHDIEEQILMGFTFRYDGKQENAKGMYDFIDRCGIKLLTDETVLVDDKFYIVGRRDGEKVGTPDGKRKTIEELTEGIDKSKPVFVIAHEPDELQETADAGADIDFSGHTHDGQLFPLTIPVRLMWENPCGMIKKDDMYSLVTSGVGVYGPFMRVGTHAEIAVLDISFKG